MTTPLQPLRVFIYQRQTAVDSWSVQPSDPGLPSNSSSVKDHSQDPKNSSVSKAHPSSARSKSSYTYHPITSYLLKLTTSLKKFLWKCTHAIARLTKLFVSWKRSSEERLFLETAYGLQLTVVNCGDINSTVDISTEVDQSHGVEPQRSECQYHYRLFPDWQTSYLWHDTRSPHNPPDEIHVDEDIIKARYPTLAPFYFAWQDIYENSFTAQGCDRGSGLDVFPDIAVRIGWEVEGLLIACWLVLQDDVEQVKYEPATGTYSIRKDNLGDILRQFLTDMDALL
ncbi:hypothetical protein ACJ72_00095 [Emergomyces africanus]|uniref:Uncharacterized protein n=1 Tax=Emergomyces africanus TaxID=1955775 RepID=A0A1B7P9F7_9EURO|nr:hypothetical protein ACJ72_00095 [Emergomyces africanus]